MWIDIKQFSAERCPLKVLLPLGTILWGAPLILVRPLHIVKAISGWIGVLMLIFILRMADDLSDLSVDRKWHPERGLSHGEIRAKRIKGAVVVGLLLLVFFNHWRPGIYYFGGLAVFYIFYYLFKTKLPVSVLPLLVNLVFLFIPLYCGWMMTGSASFPLWLLAMFIWAAVVGHDFAHSVHGLDEVLPEVDTPSRHLGSKTAAIAGLIGYLAAIIFGGVFWYLNYGSLLFGLMLAGTCILIMVLAVRLVRRPIQRNARPFYIWGFVFFLLPLLGLIIERLIMMVTG